jgi:hypothetical protein
MSGDGIQSSRCETPTLRTIWLATKLTWSNSAFEICGEVHSRSRENAIGWRFGWIAETS